MDVHAKDQGQKSKVKVTEIKTQFSRFRTITPVWIHISMVSCQKGPTRQAYTWQIGPFRQDTPDMVMKWSTKLDVA